MQVCFVQPRSGFAVPANRVALALTFPRLVCDLGLSDGEYNLYIDGRATCSFEDHLASSGSTHVFISAVSSTFPEAARLARVAKGMGCVTVLGGLFATLIGDIVAYHFPCFDYVVKGKPSQALLAQVQHSRNVPEVIHFERREPLPNMNLVQTLTNSVFVEAFEGLPVCYEIRGGCDHDCCFCTLKAAWGSRPLVNVIREHAQTDLVSLARVWRRLKVIDDDFFRFSSTPLPTVKGLFDEVVVETRIDRISGESVDALLRFGATHVILGVEAFDPDVVRALGKTGEAEQWERRCLNALELCSRHGLIVRPVILLTAPGISMKRISALRTKLAGWRPSEGIEVLFSFMTPHPGLPMQFERTRLVSTDLSQFDHLHPVYLPEPFQAGDLDALVESYNELVQLTESLVLNPRLTAARFLSAECSPFFAHPATRRG